MFCVTGSAADRHPTLLHQHQPRRLHWLCKVSALLARLYSHELWMKSHLWPANNKCPVKPVTHAIVFLPSPHLFTSCPLSCLYPLSVHRSAQQRSSQTNKSQSSAGNQVSICQVLSVTQTAAQEVEAAPHTVTAAGWLPQRKNTRDAEMEAIPSKTMLPFQEKFFCTAHIFLFMWQTF